MKRVSCYYRNLKFILKPHRYIRQYFLINLFLEELEKVEGLSILESSQKYTLKETRTVMKLLSCIKIKVG